MEILHLKAGQVLTKGVQHVVTSEAELRKLLSLLPYSRLPAASRDLLQRLGIGPSQARGGASAGAADFRLPQEGAQGDGGERQGQGQMDELDCAGYFANIRDRQFVLERRHGAAVAHAAQGGGVLGGAGSDEEDDCSAANILMALDGGAGGTSMGLSRTQVGAQMHSIV
jgi:hypothetical protein